MAGTSPAITKQMILKHSVPALRHHRRPPVARLDPLGCRREIHRRAAPVGAGVGDHEAVRARDDVALAQGGVALDLDLGEAHRVLAVAGTARNDLVAIAEGVGQIRIGLAVLGRRIVDAAAIDHFGLRSGTEAAAGFRTALAIATRDREMPSVAGPHAERLPAAAIALPRLGLLETIVERHPDHRGTRTAEAAEEVREKVLRLRCRRQRDDGKHRRRTHRPTLATCHYIHLNSSASSASWPDDPRAAWLRRAVPGYAYAPPAARSWAAPPPWCRHRRGGTGRPRPHWSGGCSRRRRTCRWWWDRWCHGCGTGWSRDTSRGRQADCRDRRP